ncbi:helix-turn-helix transcriptional regulator [Kitasatospora sp. NPDC086009]|uniref:helix-turn-helix transcriptional regulator n=1 Tax=unclassified Kitasatospora TaxID=2633591 RepID=UPI0037C83C0D
MLSVLPAVTGHPCPACGKPASLRHDLHQLLTRIAVGLTNRRIAAATGRTESEVIRWTSTLYQELPARSRIQAVDVAFRAGLLPLSADARQPEQGFAPTTLLVATQRAQGLRLEEIALRNGLTLGTVKTHTDRLHKQLGVGNGARAVYDLHSLNALPRPHPCPCTTTGRPDHGPGPSRPTPDSVETL